MDEDLIEDLTHLTINKTEKTDDNNNDNDNVTTSAFDILLSSNVRIVRQHLLSCPSGLLITGADRETRRAIIRAACPGIEITSACGHVSDDDSSCITSEPLCFDDVDFPETRVEAQVMALFPVMLDKQRTIIGLASNVSGVCAALRRAGRFEVEYQIIPPSLQDRICAWSKILDSFQLVAKTSTVKTSAEELATISPSYHLCDFVQVIHQFLAETDAANELIANENMVTNKLKRLVHVIREHRPMQASVDLPFVSASSGESKKSNATTRLYETDENESLKNNNDDDNNGGVKTNVENVWGMHAGYSEAKRTLTRLAEWPIKYGSTFDRLCIKSARGVLLHGPRGCGKTLLAKSFVEQRLVHANWLWVAGHDLFCKYLGESEARVRALFARARALSPCVIVLDDMDVIAATRDAHQDASTGSTGVEHRVFAALLTELDGIIGGDVFVLACAADVHALDPAIIRPGRLDVMLELDIPNKENRTSILKRILRNMVIKGKGGGGEQYEKEKIIEKLTEWLHGCNGAEIDGVCREAGMLALEEAEEEKQYSSEGIELRHFEEAFSVIVGERTSQ